MSTRGKKQKRSIASNPPVTASRQPQVPKLPRPALSRRRKWLFRLAVMIVSPLLFFTVLEAGLRLGGYGYSTAFFVSLDNDGGYATNPWFGWRFFPKAVSRRPAPCLLSTKPAGAIRIFVLGSSAAQGVPIPSFGVGRILEVLLRERYPDVKFEVVNAAMTAINSHVVREIAGDCAAHQPDLFVVYMGNNEVVGPYGPGTVFQHWSPSLRFIRANVWLKSTRTGQLLDDAIGWLHPSKDAHAAWQGLEMFIGNQVAADDPRLPAVYNNYRQNLIDICGIARQVGAGVVLSTVAVNLKDCPPLASQHRSDLSADDLTKWKTLYQAGVALENKEKWREAIAKYEAAATIDDRFAELPFRRGRCLAALERSTESREQFVAARDLDVLRFRADSRINAIIRDVAAEQADAGVRLADAEQSLAHSALAANGIPGEALFYEHVHFTFDGNYLLARTLLEEVEASLPQLAAARKQEPILSKEQCAERLALTPWDEYLLATITAQMTSRPPFTSQLDHDVRRALMLKRMGELGRVASTREAMRAACETYKAALEKAPDDCYLHARLAKFALASGQPDMAAEHLRIVRKRWPLEPAICSDLGNAAKACGRIEEAMDDYRKALEIDPECCTAHYSYANALKDLGRLDEAIAELQKALEADPTFVLAHNNLGNVLRRCGRIDEAVAEFQKALKLDPESVMAHNNLGTALRDGGRLDEAVAQFRAALKIDANSALTHNNLGLALIRSQQVDEAIVHFQKALEIKPDYTDARANLNKALETRDDRSGRQ